MTKVYQMYNTIIIDNFFDNFHILENHFKKIPLTSFEEYPKTIKNNATWPGKRSMPILEINPFLWQLIVKELMNKNKIIFFIMHLLHKCHINAILMLH